MDNKDFDLLFDEKVKTNIKDSFDDINMSLDLKSSIKAEAVKSKGIRSRIYDLLNYEVEIPVGRLGVIAAILAIIPTSFTIYEGKKIISNNINNSSQFVLNDKIDSHN